jgi:hypothetical protein
VSVAVDLGELRAAVAAQSAVCYLLTVADDARVHAVAVGVDVGDTELRCAAGGHSRANAAARPGVSLLWPPVGDGGHTLIVDGDAEVHGDEVVVRPTRAVLHRPAGCVTVPLTRTR